MTIRDTVLLAMLDYQLGSTRKLGKVLKDKNNKTIGTALAQSVKDGLCRRVGVGSYELTAEGRAYLGKLLAAPTGERWQSTASSKTEVITKYNSSPNNEQPFNWHREYISTINKQLDIIELLLNGKNS